MAINQPSVVSSVSTLTLSVHVFSNYTWSLFDLYHKSRWCLKLADYYFCMCVRLWVSGFMHSCGFDVGYGWVYIHTWLNILLVAWWKKCEADQGSLQWRTLCSKWSDTWFWKPSFSSGTTGQLYAVEQDTSLACAFILFCTYCLFYNLRWFSVPGRDSA